MTSWEIPEFEKFDKSVWRRAKHTAMASVDGRLFTLDKTSDSTAS